MRVGLVSPYDLSRPGGVQAQVLGLADALVERGDQVSVIGPGLPQGHEGVDLGWTVSFPGNRSLVPLSIDPRAVARLRAAAGEVEVLHVHEPLMPLVSLSALRVGRPVVATFHAAPGRVGRRFYRVVGGFLRRILGHNVRAVTAVSRTAAAPLSERLAVSIVPNGLDTAFYQRTMEREPAMVAFLGRDEPRKGLDVLLSAWDRVNTEVPRAELVVMGADRGIEGITWMGRVDDDTKARVLNQASIYVAPNLGGESFGVVLAEAMASGAPVVASDLDAFREVGREVVRYFSAGDPDALAQTLIELLSDEEARSKMSSAGREHARRYDWASVATAYRYLYNQAVS